VTALPPRAAAIWRPLAVLLLLFGVAPAAAFDHAAVAERTLEMHILPGYQRFHAAAKTFADKASALCQAPSPSALTQTRDAAREALLAWGHIEHIRFGPITKEQRLERLLLYPDPRGFTRKHVARLLKRHDDADIAPGKLAKVSVAVQGFTATDYVLFGAGSDELAKPGDTGSFRCRYVKELANGIAQIAADTLADWSGDYKRTWLEPGKSNKTYLAPKEETQAILRAYATELEVVHFHRLAPVASEGAKRSDYAKRLFAHSGHGMPYVLANIKGVRELLSQGGFTDPSLAADDRERNEMSVLDSIVTDLDFAVRAGEKAMAVEPDPLANAKAHAQLAPMIYSLKNAEKTGRDALGSLTGTSLGFNSLDGD
jgi:predicted lipoprotein